MRTLVGVPVLVFFVVASAFAQSDPGAEETRGEGPASISEQMLLSVAGTGPGPVGLGAEFDHYDDDGFPEDASGLLALEPNEDGPVFTMRDDPAPYLLYAQYENRQRDAVFLARTGTVVDPLPSGNAVEVPFGYGAVKFNTVYVSLGESLVVPHFSDNRKEYVQFPLTDLYVGGSFGLTGVLAWLRYVHTERFVGYTAVGYNPFGSPNTASILNRYRVPLHLGGGYRFPGAFPELLGENNWTVGADLMLGFGDPDGDPSTDSGVLVPGVFLDIERVLFDEAGLRRDYREDPRPYNYRVNALVVRAAAYLNVTNLGADNVFFPVFSLSYQVNVMGPKIPEHEFKETNVLYLNEIYREDLEEQARRREERAER